MRRSRKNANKEERSRMAVSGALLIGMLLMTPWVMKSFGFYGDSSEGFGLSDCVLFGGLLVMAATLGWVAFGEKFAASNGKERVGHDLSAGGRKNAGIREDERHGHQRDGSA
jgi:hypothetical protein